MRRFLATRFFALGVLPLLTLAALPVLLSATPAQAQANNYFRIDVQDADTGRGVPLVELRTTSAVRFYTDSNGIVAINDPELMGQNVYFQVKSHGYEVPADGFGNRGAAFLVKAGERKTIKIKRLNIAERLYRITGSGIYRDSLLVGAPVPTRQPLLNGLVMGQDTVFATPYKGKIFWLWGDTNRPAYPLGNFFTSSATSLLPGQGGLDPGVGIDLTYWVDAEGFSKKMMPMEGSMPVWLSALFTVRDAAGQERLFAKYAQVKSDSQVNEYGLARFNDDRAIFEKVVTARGGLFPDGHPFRATADGQEYIYFQATGSTEPFPLVRVRATAESVVDLSRYEGFTCLVAGSRYEKGNTRLERDTSGKLVYGWKVGTPPLNFDQRRELVASGKMTAAESPHQLRDIETGASIKAHGGSVFWNPYRGRWVMVAAQAGGTSYLGEMWFAEADTLAGPWVYARKILTHDKYTFYNPTQHPFFDQDGGRRIYFEGTYTNTYSNNPDQTPRYDYNQMMYRLDLSDPRLSLPEPVYRLLSGNGAAGYAMRETVAANQQWSAASGIAFYALPPGRRGAGIPIYRVPVVASEKAGMALQTSASNDVKPLFYALPASPADGEKPSPDVVPLYEFRGAQNGERWYATDAAGLPPTATRSAQPLCRVWRNPASVLALDVGTQAGR